MSQSGITQEPAHRLLRGLKRGSVPPSLPTFWNLPAKDLLQRLNATPQGLTDNDAEQRLKRHGPNLLRSRKGFTAFRLLLSQFSSPIVLFLLGAASLSFYLHARADALIILAIVCISGLLGFWQERGAANALEKLLAIVQVKATVLRDDRPVDIPVEEVVPGDVVVLNAGDVVPGDCRLLESKDLYVDEATLTGETYPVDKAVAELPEETPLRLRSNALWTGTHVVSGSARAVVAHTGRDTEFGKVSERLKLRPPETHFERGIRQFGHLLMEVTLILVIAIFAFNVYLARPIIDSFLFSVALAVGLTPQLLPAIISINLAHGAKRMAAQNVIVRRLASIENFGSMNVLCSDKTGTLTEGCVRIHSALDVEGHASEKVLFHAYLNALYQTGFTNPIDQAIRTYREFDVTGYRKLDEVPYDFIRKRLTILVSKEDRRIMVTKGALQNVLAVCTRAEGAAGTAVDIPSVRETIRHLYEGFSRKGYRALGVAYRELGVESAINKDDETGMTFLGFLLLFDPPKPGIVQTIGSLKQLGISLKIITGDNRLVAARVGRQMGLSRPRVLTGAGLSHLSDGALLGRVADVNIFAEVEPNQKERIILALQKAGSVVGYLGDGINDVSALHAADVGVSVATAVDAAKEVADIVLLEKELDVLVQGVREGRRTFANTLKYVLMATSANFGNMFSMAGVSLFLPFLPMLPKQILLTNLLTDLPEMTIATDNVDPEMVDSPRRWDIPAIRTFMINFGLLSSVFDYLTFALLLYFLHASMDEFRTGWFTESVVSASLIVLVVRSRRPFFRSRPGKYLFIATLLVVTAALVIPFVPLARLFGFRPIPPFFLIILGVIAVLYILSAEMMKRLFYAKEKH